MKERRHENLSSYTSVKVFENAVGQQNLITHQHKIKVCAHKQPSQIMPDKNILNFQYQPAWSGLSKVIFAVALLNNLQQGRFGFLIKLLMAEISLFKLTWLVSLGIIHFQIKSVISSHILERTAQRSSKCCICFRKCMSLNDLFFQYI